MGSVKGFPAMGASPGTGLLKGEEARFRHVLADITGELILSKAEPCDAHAVSPSSLSPWTFL